MVKPDSVFAQVLYATKGLLAEENPGHRLVLSAAQLRELAPASAWADVTAIRVFGYPVRLDNAAERPHLERC
jgi:hypothetical protein